MPTINDANGPVAKVNEEGQLYTLAVVHTAEHHANQAKGESYNALFAVNPAGADDCFFYLKNNSLQDLIIEGFSYTSSAAEEIYMMLGNNGTAVLTDGSIITPANLNGGSGKEADVTCYSGIDDEGVDITGLSGGRIIDKLWIITLADSKYYNFNQDVVLPKNGIFTMWCVGGDTLLRGTVEFYFHD